MSTYVIGDIQGCYQELRTLLKLINFDPINDYLWFTGDLVNRGKESLATLRFIKSLGERAICVLGNHDIHLLAVAIGVRKAHKSDTIQEILNAPDCNDLFHWLRHLPLIHIDHEKNYLMVHAGLLPQWTASQAKKLAEEIEFYLRLDNKKQYKLFLEHVFGDKPRRWKENLEGYDRSRLILNAFTRLRACDKNDHYKIDHDFKQPYQQLPENLVAWFDISERQSQNINILFGHWAALGLMIRPEQNLFALDTGCVWGGKLTAFCLETQQVFQVDAEINNLKQN